MSLQSIGNSLSLQQIMQLLQQQSLGAADPEAAAAGQAGTPDSARQNLPVDQLQAEESSTQGAQLAPAKPALDPATTKTLLEIQEAESRASNDVLLFADGGPAAQPDLSNLDPGQLQSVLAAMTGSAASGDAIASVTQYIMGLLGDENAGPEEPTDGVGPVTVVEG